MRRELDGACAAWHVLKWGLALLVITLLMFLVPSMLFRHLFIDVRSITVAGEIVTVDRGINYGFHGRFLNVVRRADDQSIVCVTGPSQSFPYVPEAVTTNPKTFTMAEWLGGQRELSICTAQGFHDGEFILSTCHEWVPFGLPFARRCVKTNAFER